MSSVARFAAGERTEHRHDCGHGVNRRARNAIEHQLHLERATITEEPQEDRVTRVLAGRNVRFPRGRFIAVDGQQHIAVTRSGFGSGAPGQRAVDGEASKGPARRVRSSLAIILNPRGVRHEPAAGPVDGSTTDLLAPRAESELLDSRRPRFGLLGRLQTEENRVAIGAIELLQEGTRLGVFRECAGQVLWHTRRPCAVVGGVPATGGARTLAKLLALALLAAA